MIPIGSDTINKCFTKTLLDEICNKECRLSPTSYVCKIIEIRQQTSQVVFEMYKKSSDRNFFLLMIGYNGHHSWYSFTTREEVP